MKREAHRHIPNKVKNPNHNTTVLESSFLHFFWRFQAVEKENENKMGQ